ncbi:MAG: DUF642 domain-containing protein [Bryobacterales bacterium]|nr:DUF642 domain-containing protein [Bryobacterales bacterium]
MTSRTLALLLTLAASAAAYEVQFAHISAAGTVAAADTTALVTSVTRGTTGRYVISVDGLIAPGQSNTPIPFVTSYGEGDSFCKPDAFNSSGLSVVCFNTAGQAVNSNFLITFVPQENDRDISWAFANTPVPNGTYSGLFYNTSPGSIAITRSATGLYNVFFNNLASGINPATGGVHFQAVAVGADSTYCRMVDWSDGTGSGISANVFCHNTAGAATDSRFLIAAIGGGLKPRALGRTYIQAGGVRPAYSVNSEGAVTGFDNGADFTVTFANLNVSRVDGRGAMVTSQNLGTAVRRCKLVSITQGNSPDITALVRCFGSAGTPSSGDFTIALMPRELVRNPGFDAPAITGSIPVPTPYRWVAASGTPFLQRLVGPPAADGSQWLQLTTSGTPSSLYQDIPTTQGTGYQLSFAFANRSGSGSSSLRVKWGSQTVATIVRTNSAWQTYSYTVYGQGATTRLQFESLTSSNAGDHLDRVRVAVDPGAPPAPTVSVQSVPSNLTVTVDGVNHTTPVNFTWTPGSTHTLQAPTTAFNADSSTRYLFSGWTGAVTNTNATLTLTAPSVNAVYTAGYSTQYRFQTSVAPPNSGSFVLTPPSSGGYYNANTFVTLSATANPGIGFTGFTGDITASSPLQTLSVNAPKSVTANFAPCTYTLPSSSTSFPAAGGEGTLLVGITPNFTDCLVTLSNLPAWITALPPAFANARYLVATNTGATRQATISISGRPFTIIQQAAAVNCTYTLHPNGPIQIPASGAAGSIQVTTTSTCSWQRGYLQPAWITSNSPLAFTGSGTVSYTVLANTGAARSGQLDMAGQSVTFVQAAAATPPAPVTAGLRFKPLTPCRLLETRPEYNFPTRTGEFGPPFLSAGSTRTLVPSQMPFCLVPASARAFVVNVTLIPRPGGGTDFVTLWPQGEPRPSVWTVRSADGQTVANTQIVKAGANGGISLFTSDAADVLLDISGYFTDDAALSNLVFYPLNPCRVIETRQDFRSPDGPFGPPSLAAGQTRRFRFPDSPHCLVPAGAAAYSVTLTVVPPAPLPFLTAWPSGNALPGVSSINSFAGRTLANNIIVPASADGSIDVYAYQNTDFLMDINGYFAADDGATGQFYFPVTQCRVYDTNAVNGPALASESARSVNVIAGACSGISASARGYAINVTAIPDGNPMPFLTAYPTGQPRPGASILNAFEGQTVTNFAIIPAGLGGQIDIFAYRRTGVVVEISGYFGR